MWMFLMLSGAIAANAQQASVLLPATYSLRDSVEFPGISKIFFIMPTEKGISAVYAVPSPAISKRIPVFIQPDYFTRQWGIFCEGEWRLEKKTGIPIRVRLGSMEYVDKLEGKK